MRKFVKKFTAVTVIIMSLISVSFSASALNENDDTNTENNCTTRYISYDCKTGEQTIIEIEPDNSGINSFEAVFNSENVTNNSHKNTRQVIGSDGRTPVVNTEISPYNLIGYLSCKKGTTTYRGTCAAFADNAVITAAHVVWGCDNVEELTIKISFGRNGDDFPYGTIDKTPQRIIIPETYLESPSADYDYAIILYDETISDNFFGFSKTVTNTTYVNITGYPKDTSTSNNSNASSNGYMQWTHRGRVTNVGTYTIRYQIDATGGQSGAPVYTDEYKLVAIHQGSITNYNVGKRLDNALFTIMKDIREDNYTNLL